MSEPDLVLRNLKGGKPRYYHERCAPAALAVITHHRPAAWVLTRRYIDVGAN
jgi:hypothetical protein